MMLHLAETRHNAATAHAHLGGVSDFAGLGRRAMEAAARDGESRVWGAKLLSALGDRVERVGIMGVDITLKGEKREWEVVGQNLPGEMAGLTKKIGGKRLPMILALDDINGLADKPEFAHWIKSATEIAAGRAGKVPVFLILVGLEEHRRQMMKHNPSVARVFQPTLFVEPWTEEETTDFFRRGFKAGGVRPDAFKHWLPYCVPHSGGFPMLAQEIGHAVWAYAREDERIAVLGLLVEATRVIERQHLQSGMVDSLNSRYKSILAKTARMPLLESKGGKFSRRNLLQNAGLTAQEKAGVDAFLRRARKLGAIVPDKESAEPGAYRFPTLLHRLYFLIATDDEFKELRTK